MTIAQISLEDRFNLEKSPVLLNGTQALVRLMLAPRKPLATSSSNPAGV